MSCSEPKTNARNVWRQHECEVMLEVFREHNINKLFDGKKYKNAEIYKLVHAEMVKKGVTNKTPEQIQTKWKSLKVAYYKCKKLNNTSGKERTVCDFFDSLDEILGSRPSANLDGVDAVDIPPGESQVTVEIDESITEDELSQLFTVSSEDVSPGTSRSNSAASTRPLEGTPRFLAKKNMKRRRTQEEQDTEFFQQQQQMMMDFF